jgi:ArsR family metal-binding transcriptional regulator
MRVDHVEKVYPCIADPWKLRIIAHLDEEPDLPFLAKYLDCKYSENLGMVAFRSGIRELNFFQNGQVTVRMVDTAQEAIDFVNHVLTMADHKAFLADEF